MVMEDVVVKLYIRRHRSYCLLEEWEYAVICYDYVDC